MYIAAHGWDHSGWSGPFYPADLPPEWRLTYYANEFDAVVVPAVLWRAAAVTAVRQWVEDTGSAFRFFLEGDSGERPSPLLLGTLGERFGGVLGAGGVMAARWEGGADARALRGLLEGLPDAGVLVVAGTPPSLDAMRIARTLVRLLGR